MEMNSERIVLTDATVDDLFLLAPFMRTRVPPEAAGAVREWSLARAIRSRAGEAKARTDVLRSLASLGPARLAEAFSRPVEVRVGDPWVSRHFEVPLDGLAGLLASGVMGGANYAVSRDGTTVFVTAWR